MVMVIMKKGQTILVKEKQHNGISGTKYTDKIVQVTVSNVLSDGVHATQICSSDGKPMTMRYFNEEIVSNDNQKFTIEDIKEAFKIGMASYIWDVVSGSDDDISQFLENDANSFILDKYDIDLKK